MKWRQIGVLDIRLLNLDRHLGNILVTKESNGVFNLVPIDHGYVICYVMWVDCLFVCFHTHTLFGPPFYPLLFSLIRPVDFYRSIGYVFVVICCLVLQKCTTFTLNGWLLNSA